MRPILRCVKCAAYTMKEVHNCGVKTVIPKPAKWSPIDKYGTYRLEARKHELKEKGLA